MAAVRRSDRRTPHGGDRVPEDARAERRLRRTCPRGSIPCASPPSADAPSPQGVRPRSPFDARSESPSDARASLPYPRRNRFRDLLPGVHAFVDDRSDRGRFPTCLGNPPVPGMPRPARAPARSRSGSRGERGRPSLRMSRRGHLGVRVPSAPGDDLQDLERRLRQPGCPASRRGSWALRPSLSAGLPLSRRRSERGSLPTKSQ